MFGLLDSFVYFRSTTKMIGSTQKNQEAQTCRKGCCLFYIFFSETTRQIGTKLGRNVHWIVLLKVLFSLIKTTQRNTLFDTFFCVASDQHKLFIGPSNEHSYQIWFLLAQWFHSDHNVFQLKLLVSTSDVYGRNILNCKS
jgi:hypothetical protein